MKIKIVSDGTSVNTCIENAETGEILDGVKEITWHCKVGGIATVNIQLVKVEITAVGDAVRKYKRK